MFCPRCGTENNNDGVKFCRSCGEDLRLMLQVMAKPKSWHIVLARQVEEYLVSKKQRSAEAGAFSLFCGFILLLAAIVNAFTWNWQWGVIMGLGALVFVFFGTLEWRRYKREIGEYTPEPERVCGDLSIYKSALPSAEVHVTRNVERLNPAQSSQKSPAAMPPASITEHTTKHLNMNAKQTNDIS